MPSPDFDLRYLRGGVESLKDYLLSEQLFWTLGLRAPSDDPHYPQMTLGNLLLSQARLHAHQQVKVLSAAQSADLADLDLQFDGLREQWRSAWEKKAYREFNARLRQWGHYLDELAKDQDRQAAYFPNEVRLRALLELLKEHTGLTAPVEAGMLAHPDKRLKTLFERGEFLWEEELKVGFPEEKYWFLYGSVENTKP